MERPQRFTNRVTMYDKFRIICTVCARAGSKGLRSKNKAIIANRPLIAYTLETAKACNFIDDIIVSSDDAEIREIAQNSGVLAPFVRPRSLSMDDTPKIEVIRHAVSWAEDHYDSSYDIVLDLSVTSPIRRVDDVKASVELLVNRRAENVFSVSPPARNPYYSVVEVIDDKVKLVKALSNELSRRQDAPQVYDMNGSIYVWWKVALSKNDSLFNDTTKIYVMPRHRGIDIDDQFDLFVASMLLEHPNKYWELP
jgi:CMP-N-acetylneuraminic acid synthetase